MIRTIAAALILFGQAAAASAQVPATPRGSGSTATNCAPTRPSPDGDGVTTRGDKPLSDQLAQSGGVLCPPPGVSPEMRVPAPDDGTAKTPVIPPPGSPGGDPSVRPK